MAIIHNFLTIAIGLNFVILIIFKTALTWKGFKISEILIFFQK